MRREDKKDIITADVEVFGRKHETTDYQFQDEQAR